MHPPVQLVRASIDVRASVAEALRRWGEFPPVARLPARVELGASLPDGAASGMVAFRPLNETESRVTVHLEYGRVASAPPHGVELARRELEQDLRAFKRFLEASDPSRPEQGSC